MIRSKEEWKALMKEQEQSGKSVRAFCIERGMSATVFYAMRAETKSKKDLPGFARVQTDNHRIELELSNGTRLRVERADLKAVLEALQ
jgi:hypothetical protein